MQIEQAAIMGVIQGLTEFLPVSSSGHIVLSSALYKLFTGANFEFAANEEIFFDILIHLATLFAVVLYFFKDIKKLFCNFFAALFARRFEDYDFKFTIYILIASFVTCIIGIFIKDFARKITQNPFAVSILLMVTGVVLYIAERFKIKNKNINLKTAILTGIAQGFAVLPGISRSGVTISCAVLNGVNKFDAAKFSFILSIPIIIIASVVYPLITFDLGEIKSFNFNCMALGMAISFVTGYICIKYFMNFLKKGSLKEFAYYCFCIAAICMLIFKFAA